MLNIDNSETEQAIYRLAQHLGITPTEAIAVAIHRELARLEQKRQTEFERISQAADAVRRECSPEQWIDPDSLYDAQGLPT